MFLSEAALIPKMASIEWGPEIVPGAGTSSCWDSGLDDGNTVVVFSSDDSLSAFAEFVLDTVSTAMTKWSASSDDTLRGRK